jgi:hypothetical protein
LLLNTRLATEADMKRLLLVGCFLLTSTSGYPQINAHTLTLAGVRDCVMDAVGNNATEDDGSAIIFSCSADKAKTLYNFLGRKVRAEAVQDHNGRFENRPFGNSACYHRIEDASGKTADDFRCDLIMTIGDALSE